MALTVRTLAGGSLIVWAAAVAFATGTAAHETATQKTANDGIYTKAQADGAKKQFEKICADCHAFTVAAKKKPKDLPLGDEPFFETWSGRPVVDLVNVIALTMPNDGSAVLSEAEAIDLVAYVLQQNGFPAGSTPLTKEAATALIDRPKK